MGFLSSIFGGETKSQKELRKTSTAPFESGRIQRFLPPALRESQTGPITAAGIQGIGELIRNPGGLSPTVSEAILPRLAMESENIAQNFRGIGSQQAGAAARGNLPVSIKTALGPALDIAQERAQRDARRGALSESEQLRRQDLQQTYSLLDAILQFISSGRGAAVQGLGAAAGAEQQALGSLLSLGGSVFSTLGTAGLLGGAGAAAGAGTAGFIGGLGPYTALMSSSSYKEDFESVSEDDILDAIQSLPVYEWSYKGEAKRHIGPMAEDFLATFELGGEPDRIYVVDAIGTLMAATQALGRRMERLERRRLAA